MMLFVLAAFAADPIVEPWDFEARLGKVESRLSAVEAKLGIAAPAPLPAAKPNTTAPVSDFTNPTWHYAEGTTLVRDANGILVPSQAATQISYPGQPMQVAPPPAFYAPPPPMYGPFGPQMPGRRGLFGGRGLFRGGANCSGSS